MRPDGLETESVFKSAHRFQRPKFHRHSIVVVAQPCACDRSEHPVSRLTKARAWTDRLGTVRDANVVAHALDLLVCPSVDPRKTLEFGIELGPLLERLRRSQSHFDGLPEVRGTGIRSVDVAVEL